MAIYQTEHIEYEVASGEEVTVALLRWDDDRRNHEPATAESWSSSNPAIATVTGAGVVTGVAPGTVHVDALVDSANGVMATCDVRVLHAGGFDTFRTEHFDYSLAVGGTTTVNVIGTRADGSQDWAGAESWTSSNAAVATVDTHGTVTAVAAGTATIDGLIHVASGTVVACEVTVTGGFGGFSSYLTKHFEYHVVAGGTVTVDVYGVRPDQSQEWVVAESWSSMPTAPSPASPPAPRTSTR